MFNCIMVNPIIVGYGKSQRTTEKFRFLVLSAVIKNRVQYDLDVTIVSILA